MKKTHIWIRVDIGRGERLGYQEQIFDTGAELILLPYDVGLKIGLYEQPTDFSGIKGEKQ